MAAFSPSITQVPVQGVFAPYGGFLLSSWHSHSEELSFHEHPLEEGGTQQLR